MCTTTSTFRIQRVMIDLAMQKDHGKGALTGSPLEDLELDDRMVVLGHDIRDRHVGQIPQIPVVLGVSNGLKNVIIYYGSAHPSGVRQIRAF